MQSPLKYPFRQLAQDSWLGHLLAWLAGASLTLTFAPFNLWPLALLSFALLALLCQQLKGKALVIRSWMYGFGLFGTGTWWVYVSIHTYGYTPPVLAIPFTLIFTGGIALLFPFQLLLYRKLSQTNFSPWVFAASWVLFEWIRSWLLTGFPWLYVGYSQLNTPLAGYAPVLGIYGVSFLLVLTASLLLQSLLLSIKQPRLYPQIAINLLLIVLIWGGGQLLTQQQWTQPKQQLSVALVQGNIPQEMKWLLEMQDKTLQIYDELTVDHWDADIIVWPEAAIPLFYDEALLFLDNKAAQALEHNNTFITGIPFRTMENQKLKYYNSMISLDAGLPQEAQKSPEGSSKDSDIVFSVYNKQKLVPFGEVIPLESWIRGLIPFFDLPLSSFSRGETAQSGLTGQGSRISTFICYEVVYPDFFRHYAKDSELMLTVSNDAWFGDSIGPLQHAQMTQMRALEAGRWLLRATNNGVTMIVNNKGQVTGQLPQFEAGVLRGEVQTMTGLTPFLRWGSWPVAVCCGLILMGAQIRRQRKISQ